MNIKDFAESLGLSTVCMPDDTREVETAYAGDLLSWVMGRAPADSAWVTIMSNVNIVAVAMLRDVAAVIVAEGAEIPEDVIDRANQQGINIFSSPKGTYELCVEISEII